MKHTIEIHDKDRGGFLSPGLLDILTFLKGWGESLSWSILDIEATAKGEIDLNLLIRKIENSPTGLHLNWDELTDLGRKLNQVINLILVGCGDRNMIPQIIPGEIDFSNCDIVIEAVDSTFWRITAKNQDVIIHFWTAFKDVRLSA